MALEKKVTILKNLQFYGNVAAFTKKLWFFKIKSDKYLYDCMVVEMNYCVIKTSSYIYTVAILYLKISVI